MKEIFMHAAVRPYVTTGIALVGASIIAVSPITAPTPPDIRVTSPAVELTQSADTFNPLQLYVRVVEDTLKNANILTQVYLAEPFPIIQAILGRPTTAPTDIPTALGWVANSAVSWAIAGAASIGYAGVVTIGAFFAGLLGFAPPFAWLEVIIGTPAAIAGSMLNGFDVFGHWPGLLNPGALGVPLGPGLGTPPFNAPGLIGSLIALDQSIGAAISSLFHPTSTPLAAANEAPKPGATTLTLTTAQVGNSGSTPADSAPAKTASPDITIQPEALVTINLDKPAKNGADTISQAEHELDTAAVATINPDNPDKSGPDTTNPAPHGLDTAIVGAANANDGLAQARSNASSQGQHGLETATSAINNASTGIRDGNKVAPGQVDGDSTPSDHDAVKAAKPVGDQADSKPSKTGTDTENDHSNSSAKGSKG